MFSKAEVESILSDLKREHGGNPQQGSSEGHHQTGIDPHWERLLRDVYLGMARADAGVDLGALDPRVIAIVQRYQKKAGQKA